MAEQLTLASPRRCVDCYHVLCGPACELEEPQRRYAFSDSRQACARFRDNEAWLCPACGLQQRPNRAGGTPVNGICGACEWQRTHAKRDERATVETNEEDAP